VFNQFALPAETDHVPVTGRRFHKSFFRFAYKQYTERYLCYNSVYLKKFKAFFPDERSKSRMKVIRRYKSFVNPYKRFYKELHPILYLHNLLYVQKHLSLAPFVAWNRPVLLSCWPVNKHDVIIHGEDLFRTVYIKSIETISGDQCTMVGMIGNSSAVINQKAPRWWSASFKKDIS